MEGQPPAADLGLQIPWGSGADLEHLVAHQVPAGVVVTVLVLRSGRGGEGTNEDATGAADDPANPEG